MNIVLWIAQGLVALVMIAAGSVKTFLPRERLEKRMHWAATWPRARIKMLGLAEIAGGLGLVLPMAVGVAPILTPVAALCLAVLMIGAVQTHARARESFAPPLVLILLCFAIAVGRLRFGA